MIKVTEQDSFYRKLEQMTTKELLTNINKEDQKVAQLISEKIDQIEKLIDSCYSKMKEGGRLFYIGSGTSGRLGILDASECPPTFGVPFDWVIGIISGGDSAIRKAVEWAEDDINLAWSDLLSHDIDQRDFVIGIAASGSTPYVIHGLKTCQQNGITTGSISCNPDTEVSKYADYPIEVVVGPEFVTGSTRMKAGTAQKMVLNMISTSLMIKLGRVEDNKMVDMQLSNNKLVDRGVRMVMDKLKMNNYEKARTLLLEHGSVRDAVNAVKT